MSNFFENSPAPKDQRPNAPPPPPFPECCANLRLKVKDLTLLIQKYRKWIDDLHSGMYINCVYCGYRYGPMNETPSSMADVLKQHISQCPDHPMSLLKTQYGNLKEAAETLLYWHEECGTGHLVDEYTADKCDECKIIWDLKQAVGQQI